MVQAKALPTTSNYRKHTTKNPLKRIWIENYHNQMLSLIAPLNPKSILDAGCGEGFILKFLYENKIGKRLEGVEFSDDALNIGKILHPYLTLKKGNIYSLSYKNKQFDIVLCTEVLEHLDNPAKALSEVERVSSKYVLITVPHEPWWTLFNFTKWGKSKEIGHINKWSSSSFQKFIINHSSLIIKEVRLAFPWTMILAEKIN